LELLFYFGEEYFKKILTETQKKDNKFKLILFGI